MSRLPLASVALAVTLAGAPTIAAADPPAATPGAPAPDWRQIYETSESVYYVRTAAGPAGAAIEASSLIEFKIPQVLDGVQVWSVVSHMTLDCAGRRMVTLDNTSFASKMGTGHLVASQKTGDTWHPPQSGSLGELIWNTGCSGK